ncbi:hypothetical protein K438DRAFT_1787379 [Mycena galopus ATCC 62051]|nr:hypothetical protein K438DRAFT_1787379 [Mycena galopus ATCC 62051]
MSATRRTKSGGAGSWRMILSPLAPLSRHRNASLVSAPVSRMGAVSSGTSRQCRRVDICSEDRPVGLATRPPLPFLTRRSGVGASILAAEVGSTPATRHSSLATRAEHLRGSADIACCQRSLARQTMQGGWREGSVRLGHRVDGGDGWRGELGVATTRMAVRGRQKGVASGIGVEAADTSM